MSVESEDSLIAFLHGEGIEAAHEAEPSPLKCPLPIDLWEETIAWFAGYSLGALTRGRPKYRQRSAR